MFTTKPKNSHGKGKGVIPFAVGTVANAKLLGYLYAPTSTNKTNKGLTQFLSEVNALQDEAAIDDHFTSKPMYEDMCYLAVVIEVNGSPVQTIDIGFSPEGTPIKVVERPYKDANGDEKPGKAYEIATKAELEAWNKANLEAANG